MLVVVDVLPSLGVETSRDVPHAWLFEACVHGFETKKATLL